MTAWRWRAFVLNVRVPPLKIDNVIVHNAARVVLNFLGAVDAAPTEPADAVIGFGVFDLRLPRYCAELYAHGLARRIIFTGGIGGGTGNLGGPEADVWRADVKRFRPDIPDDAFILENRSTNTAENIRYTAELLAMRHPQLAFGTGITSAIVVASPSRLRRVGLTMRQLQPGVRITRRLPGLDFDTEYALYEKQGVPYLAHLVGELERIETYPLRGWIAAEQLPDEILTARELLRKAL